MERAGFHLGVVQGAKRGKNEMLNNTTLAVRSLIELLVSISFDDFTLSKGCRSGLSLPGSGFLASEKPGP